MTFNEALDAYAKAFGMATLHENDTRHGNPNPCHECHILTKAAADARAAVIAAKDAEVAEARPGNGPHVKAMHLERQQAEDIIARATRRWTP